MTIMKKSGLPYTVYINRPLGKFIIKFLPKFVTPNMITITSFILFCCCIIAMPSVDNYAKSAILTLFFLFQYVLDSADGILARSRGISSPIGEWLDHSLDGLRILILHVAVLQTFYLNFNDFGQIHILAVCLSIIGMGGNFIINQLKVKILNIRSGDVIENLHGLRSFFTRVLFFPADSGVYYFCFLAVHTTFFIYIYLIWSVYFFMILISSFALTLYQASRA